MADGPAIDADSAQPPPTRAERVPGEKRRAQILEAARELFVRYGYDGTRTKEIAEHAGTREGVLYRHFESKEQLFDEAVLAPLTEWVASASVASAEIAEATDPHARIAALRRTNERLVEAVVGITPLLGVALFSSSERGRRSIATTSTRCWRSRSTSPSVRWAGSGASRSSTPGS